MRHSETIVARTVRSRIDNSVGVLYRNHNTKIYEVYLFDRNNPKPTYATEQTCYNDAEKVLTALVVT